MIEADFTLEILLEPRRQLHQELPQQLSPNHRQFLNGLVHAQPDCSLLRCPHADPLPALRWKLANLATFQKRCPQDLAAQAMRLIPGCFRVDEQYPPQPQIRIPEITDWLKRLGRATVLLI